MNWLRKIQIKPNTGAARAPDHAGTRGAGGRVGGEATPRGAGKLVELPGIEPGSPELVAGLLRA